MIQSGGDQLSSNYQLISKTQVDPTVRGQMTADQISCGSKICASNITLNVIGNWPVADPAL